MSEPHSFYSKIKIKKENYEKFLAAEPSIIKKQNGWHEWWNSINIKNKPELKNDNLIEYEDENNKEIISGWLNSEEAFSFSIYDDEDETWHFGILYFTDNYLEMIPMLGAMRGIAGYKEKDDSDFIMIYSSFRKPEMIDAYLKFNDKESYFTEKPDKKDIEFANNFLMMKWSEFVKVYRAIR